MARERLTWKAAGMNKKADPYTMNQNHANNPVEKYETGNPDAWAETPDMRRPWEGEGRTETGHPAPVPERAPAPAAVAPAPAPAAAPAAAPAMEPAQQAVMAARKLEDKALKCITIAQRMLPGAADDLIELQATDLMYMPEKCVLATLSRQTELAERLAGEECAEPDADDKPKKDEPAAPAAPATPVEAKKDEKDEKAEKPADAPADAPVPGAAPAAPAPVAPVMAKKEDEKDEKPADAPAAAPADAAPAPAAAPAAETPVEASKDDLLDLIFADEQPKQGAAKLAGLVKKASSVDDNNLSSLWDAPPDVSKAFK